MTRRTYLDFTNDQQISKAVEDLEGQIDALRKELDDMRVKREEALKALKLMCQARDSYSNEFNPGNKIKGIADWGLINEAWCAADSILANG